MKPISAFASLFLIGLLFMSGAFMFTADRAVQAEYAHRAEAESKIASRIAQYQAAREGQQARTVNGGGVITAVLALAIFFTAVNGFMGKDGLTGVLRQVNRMMPKRSRPSSRQPVNAPAPLLPPSYEPVRERELLPPVNTAVHESREGGRDAIEWI